jgi:hypothetical protein
MWVATKDRIRATLFTLYSPFLGIPLAWKNLQPDHVSVPLKV